MAIPLVKIENDFVKLGNGFMFDLLGRRILQHDGAPEYRQHHHERRKNRPAGGIFASASGGV
jgi:hypothetical protein